MSGNFILSHRARFIGRRGGASQIGWTICSRSNPRSAHVTAALHGTA